MKGADWPARGVEPVQFARSLERIRVDRLDGVDRGSLAVEPLDAIKISLHQFDAAEVADIEGLVDLVDRGLENPELLSRRRTGMERREECDRGRESRSYTVPTIAHPARICTALATAATTPRAPTRT